MCFGKLCYAYVPHSLNEKIAGVQFNYLFCPKALLYFPVSPHFYSKAHLFSANQQVCTFSLSSLLLLSPLDHSHQQINVPLLLHLGGKILLLILILQAILQSAPHFPASPNINTFQSYPCSLSTIYFFPFSDPF